MTLAFIFLFGLLGTTPRVPLRADSPPQSAAPSAQEAAPSEGQQQDQKPAAAPDSENKSGSPHPQATTKPGASAARAHTHKKRPANADCAAAPAHSPAATNPDAKPSATPAGGDKTQAAKSGDVPKNCPPPKIVVPQGGTTEPSIQLAGGPATAQASDQKNAAMQLLGTTEENLKKISGRQLSSEQQDTLTQIQQFVQQSKTAAANGDAERARNLAWKAELLSEDLVSPEK